MYKQNNILIILSASFLLLSCMNGWGEKGILETGGIALSWRDEGEGEPVVLVHGAGATAFLNWQVPGIASMLKKNGYRVITFDNRGHGNSSKPAEPEAYGIEMIRDVIRIMDHRGIDKAHIAGYSLGGYITLKLSTLYPDRVLSAVICASGWKKITDERLQKLERIESSLDEGRGYRPLLDELRPPDGKKYPLRLAMINIAMRILNDEKAMACIFNRLPEFEVSEEALRACPVPVLAITGDRDPLGRDAALLAGVIPDFETAVIPGGTHFSTVRQKAFSEMLLSFINSHSVQKNTHGSMEQESSS